MSDSKSSSVLLAGQSSMTFLSTIINKIVRFVGVAIITSLVSPAVFGTYSLCLSIVLILSKVSNLGLDKATDYYLPKFLQTEEYGKAKFVFVFISLIGSSFSAGLLVIVVVNTGIIVNYLSGDLVGKALPLMLISLPFTVFNRSSFRAFVSVKKASYRSLSKDIIYPVFQVTISVLLVILGYDLLGLTGGYVIAVGLSTLFNLYIIGKHIDFMQVPLTLTPIKNIFTYSIPLMFSGAMYAIIGEIDFILIGFINKSVENVGFYRSAFVLASSLLLFHTSIVTIIKPMMVEAGDDHSELLDKYQLATRWSLLLSFPAIITLISAPNIYLGYLFAPEYTEASIPLVVLSLGYFGNIMIGPEERALEATGDSQLILVNTFIMLLVNCIVGIALIPRIGIVGAAMGSASAIIISSSIGLIEVYFMYGLSPFSPQYIRLLVTGALTGSIGIVMSNQISSEVLTAVLLPLIVIVCYLAIGVKIKIFTKEDIDVIESIEDKFDITAVSKTVERGVE